MTIYSLDALLFLFGTSLLFLGPFSHLIYKLKQLECFSKSCCGVHGVSIMLGVELVLGCARDGKMADGPIRSIDRQAPGFTGFIRQV